MSDAIEGRQGWRDISEHGTTLGIRAVVVMATIFGRFPTRILGACIAFYYTLFSRAARDADEELRRRLGESGGFWVRYRHVRSFVQCTHRCALLPAGQDPRVSG